MTLPNRPIAFVLAASNHGLMIVNRNDYNTASSGQSYGVGHQILNHSCFDPTEVQMVLNFLDRRRQYFGPGVVALDGGANIGVHTLEWARHMHDWGSVLSFEAQEIVYYALAGNIVLNNCLNVRAKNAALGEHCGQLNIPQPNYLANASFGSLELKQRQGTENIGQDISYDLSNSATVPQVSVDSLNLLRLDFLKLDVEGMEIEVLRGAANALARCKPIILVEIIKSDEQEIRNMLYWLGYEFFPAGNNLIAIHRDDPTKKEWSIN